MNVSKGKLSSRLPDDQKPQPEPVPEHLEPSKSGYGHAPNTSGSTAPQGGGNPIGPDEENAGTKGRKKGRRIRPTA